MAGSVVEREIRNTVIDKIRQVRPGSRIIHELNTAGTGSPRADLAVIGPAEILLFEIKSERDVLKRLESQWNAFRRCSHQTFMVLDRKFFTEKVYANGVGSRVEAGEALAAILNKAEVRDNVWPYPEPAKHSHKYMDQTWKIKPLYNTPDLRATLRLLWREELVQVLKFLNIAYGSRDNIDKLIERAILGATGRQVIEGVCMRLRARPFAEADDPIPC